MKDIAIFGAGGFGKEVAVMIRRINEKCGGDWNFIGFFDDGKEIGYTASHFGEVLGGMTELNKWDKELAIAIAVGSTESLYSIKQRITNKNVYFPNIIDPDVELSDPESLKIGEGNIIRQGCRMSCDVTIGSFNVLNTDVVAGHDVKIGDYNIIMPDIRISGEVVIGTHCLIGVGSVILQRIKIGTGVRLAAGAVLLTKPKDNSLYMGNPAKRIQF